MSKYIEQSPVTFVTEYSPIVSFNNSVLITQHTLDANDTIEPLLDGNAKPACGAVYRLIGDGTHAPVFSPLFKKSATSLDYVLDLNVINLIIFLYDGFDFWYTITQPVPPPPV